MLMKPFKFGLFLIIVLMFCTPGYPQQVQNRADQGIYGYGNHRNYILDTTHPIVLEGKVIEVKQLALGTGRFANGISLVIKDIKQEILVHVGPIAYLNSLNLQFKTNGHYKLKIYKGTYVDKTAFFAAEVFQKEKKWLLRDNYGLPLWRLSRQGGRGRGRDRGRNRWNTYN